MNLSDYNNIWVFAEHRDDEPLAIYFELLSKAKELASCSEKMKVCSVVLGSEADEVVDKIAATGTDIVYYVNHKKLANYNIDYYAKVLEKLIAEYKPEILLMGATAVGSELAPTVAAKVKTGIAAHCVDIEMNENNELVSMVPAFGGKIVSEILVPNHRPQMASIRPGILPAEKHQANPDVQIVRYACKELDTYDSKIEYVGFKPTVISGKSLEKETEIVICAGRGVGTDETWERLNALADKFNAPVGYTRGIVDVGIVDNEVNMIGTSGKSIKPKVCLNFGISGAMHFACGIQKSKMIISINRDEDAKIFDLSDYKVIGDADKIIQALLRKKLS